jgi:response regulator RpfG family c-di-GMP phosphodiesterase
MTRILLVDNDPAWLDSMKRSLPGYEVDTAESYEGARALIQREMVYEVAIVDLNLVDSHDHNPGDLLGGEILLELRRDRPSTRRIALTGWPPSSVRREVFDKYDVDDLLLKKSMSLAVLREVVRVALARTPVIVAPKVREQASELWETFRGWREDLRRLLNQRLRTVQNDLRGAGRLRDDDEKYAQTVAALEARRAALESRKDSFSQECSRLEALLVGITSTADIAVVSREVEEARRKFDVGPEIMEPS